MQEPNRNNRLAGGIDFEVSVRYELKSESYYRTQQPGLRSETFRKKESFSERNLSFSSHPTRLRWTFFGKETFSFPPKLYPVRAESFQKRDFSLENLSMSALRDLPKRREISPFWQNSFRPPREKSCWLLFRRVFLQRTWERHHHRGGWPRGWHRSQLPCSHAMHPPCIHPICISEPTLQPPKVFFQILSAPNKFGSL